MTFAQEAMQVMQAAFTPRASVNQCQFNRNTFIVCERFYVPFSQIGNLEIVLI